LLLDKITGGLIAIQAAQDLGRDTPVEARLPSSNTTSNRTVPRSCGSDFTR
jgi:hypothetical protein